MSFDFDLGGRDECLVLYQKLYLEENFDKRTSCCVVTKYNLGLSL